MSHPSVTTYRIEGPVNNDLDRTYQEGRGRSSPSRSRQKRTTKLSRAHLYDQNANAHTNDIGRNPIVPTQYQPSRGRAYSNDLPPLQNRSSADFYGQVGASSRLSDRVLPAVPATGLWSVLDHLPQPADDQTIIGMVQQVFFLVDNFVDNHYRDLSGLTIGNDSDFMRTKFPYLSDGLEPADVLFVLAHPTIAIRHCIIYMLFSCISFDNSNNTFSSFLPPEFTVTESALSRSRPEIDECDAALSAHRVLLSYLRTGVYHDPEYQEHLNIAMEQMGKAISTAFSPWREPQSADNIWVPALTAIMQTTAQLGLLLFAQPSTFRFVWLEAKSNTKGDCAIEVHPRLLKINDEQARDLNPSQLMLNTKAQRTKYLNDDEMQRILYNKGMNHSTATNSENYGQTQVAHPDPSLQNTTMPQRLNIGSGSTSTTSAHVGHPAIELPTDLLPQLAELSATEESFSRELNVSLNLDGQNREQNREQNKPDRFHARERQADEINNGTPRSPMKNGSTRDAYSQQMYQRQQITSCPPTASRRLFDANPLPERKRSKSSKHRRSSSASSETRGRSQGLLVQTQRRASISNDRASMMEYGHRTPETKESLQPVTSFVRAGCSSSTLSNGTTDHILLPARNMPITNSAAAEFGGRRTNDQRSMINEPQATFPSTPSNITQRNLREEKKSKWKFWGKNG